MSRHFHFSHENLKFPDNLLERVFQIIPGLLSWTVLISLVLLAFLSPLKAAMVIIAYDIYWLFRLFYMTLFMVLAYLVLAIERETDWTARCHSLEKSKEMLPLVKEKKRAARKAFRLREWFSCKNQERDLKKVITEKIHIPDFDSLYHVVIIAVANESQNVVEPGLQALTQSQFPPKKILPVLAVEERTGPHQRAMAEALQQKYGHFFMDFMVVIHPDDIPGEARVKGANVTYAAKKVTDFFRQKEIDFEKIIVSCFDSDTVPPPEYFAALAYHFMRNPHRTRSSYQPVPVYHNNIWEAPGFARVLEMGSSFFQLVEATNPEKLVTFSSHSMSFKALVEVGYWPVDMISDDSAIFWKALIHYGGDYRVVPMYVTLSMDVAMASSRWKTVINIYRQKRRWAWGVENFPIVMRGFLHDQKISGYNKFRYTVKLIEMHLGWATMGFIILIIGWLPAIFAGREFSSSVLYYNSPRITSLIFNLALTALAVTIVLSLFLLPKKKTRNPFLKRVLFALEWMLVPLVYTFLSTLPALEAQTRLMRGHIMQFRITEKARR